LLLLGFDGVTQFFPGVILRLYWRRVTRPAVWSGIVAGVGTVALLVLSGRDPIAGLNAGFVTLCLNFLFVVVVSFVTKAGRNGLDMVAGATGAETEP
jgi:SSS family solute:Na+ symporter